MDVSRLNMVGVLAQMVPEGPGQDDDLAIVSTGSVIDRDVDGRRVRVALRGGDVWLPAVAGRYVAGAVVRVLFDPTSARPVLVAGVVDSGPPAALGSVVSVSGTRLTVQMDGKTVTIPSVVGVYTVGEAALILLDDWGAPMIALGPSTVPPPPTVAPPPSAEAATVTATATIGPQSSGTFRVPAGRWDQWNTNRYGGSSDIYQGSGYGSGQLRGFAGYGDQIANLGALSIDEAVLTARKTADGNSAVLTVQGTAAGDRPAGEPLAGPFEAASSESIGSGGTGTIALPAGLREAFRTGSARGLVAVGSQYGGFGGTATPGSFVLSIRYTRRA